MYFLKRAISYVAVILSSLLLTLIIMEVCYRSFFIDFYQNQFEYLNNDLIDGDNYNHGNDRILVFGDSFSADSNSYVKVLKDSLSKYHIMNAAVPGTTIREASIMQSYRLQQTKPTKIIYQIYIGNDLIEWKHPYEGKDLSMARKIYWWLSDRIWVVSYINRQLPYVRSSFSEELLAGKHIEKPFNKVLYSSRTKLYCQAQANFLKDAILMRSSYDKIIDSYFGRLEKFIVEVPIDIELVLLIIPDKVQISMDYMSHLNLLGCNTSYELLSSSYPLMRAFENLEKSYSHVSIINPIEELRQKNKIREVYYSNDSHLNEYGQKVLGEFVFFNLK